MWGFYVSVPAFHPVFLSGHAEECTCTGSTCVYSMCVYRMCVCVYSTCVYSECVFVCVCVCVCTVNVRVCTVNVRKGACGCSKCVRGGRVHSIQDSFSCRN